MTATPPITIRKIGVIGAGQIGCGIAHVCAVSGFDVYLVDISTEALERARSNMTDSLDHQVSKGKISEATQDGGARPYQHRHWSRLVLGVRPGD